MWVQSPCQEDPLEKEMATHSSVLAWEIPWAEVPSRRVGHNSMTKQQQQQMSYQGPKWWKHLYGPQSALYIL